MTLPNVAVVLAENAELRAEVERLKTQLSIAQTTQHIHDQRQGDIEKPKYPYPIMDDERELTELPNVWEVRFGKREWIA